MKFSIAALFSFSGLAVALPLAIPGTSGDNVQIIECLERRNGE